MVYLTYAMQCHRNWPPKPVPRVWFTSKISDAKRPLSFPFFFRESILSVCMIWTPKAMEATGPDHHVVDLDFFRSQLPDDPLFPHRPLHPQTQRLYQYQNTPSSLHRPFLSQSYGSTARSRRLFRSSRFYSVLSYSHVQVTLSQTSTHILQARTPLTQSTPSLSVRLLPLSCLDRKTYAPLKRLFEV